ncbi:Endonuclease archaeal Holliday junction resolvase protein [Marine Group I thaumarchaeote SCGC AAA799-E16]|uniref:Holliday junction resolvase-like protein n=2 Tax=Marine Group I TaxID=905826 RepID=A0A087S183_9ARCH|nr:Endonuclease archaeal Holliday junction resolvase protein [Marine Group I thaumarchaeote SCGC AAA799-E16]KFM19487.1 Holliday junction resolvase-like protein [Marine Group I thaumarchaeote SCGC RSA3]
MKILLFLDVSSLIQSLNKSKLIAECPDCGDEFPLSKALLFDGRGEFPDKAEEKRKELLKELKERSADLLERQKRATTKSENTAIAVGIGKIVEKILPAHKNFDLVPADCRFLAEPIDMIVFDGVSKNKVDKITFMDVKTGSATLNKHQRQVRDAIEDNNVKWESY